jgi:hypothetical protein
VTTIDEEAKIREQFRQGEVQRRFLEAHSERLRCQYPDKFVVFRGENVIETADDLLELVENLRAKNIKMGGDVWSHYFPSDFQAWIRSWHP